MVSWPSWMKEYIKNVDGIPFCKSTIWKTELRQVNIAVDCSKWGFFFFFSVRDMRVSGVESVGTVITILGAGIARVSIVFRYELGDRGIAFRILSGARDFALLQSFQTGSEAYLASCSVGMRVYFPSCKTSAEWSWPLVFSKCFGKEWMEL